MSTYVQQYTRLKAQAVKDLLAHFQGNKSAMAAAAGLHPQNGHQWVRLGRVSKKAARLFDANPDVPFSKEQLRPDVRVW